MYKCSVRNNGGPIARVYDNSARSMKISKLVARRSMTISGWNLKDYGLEWTDYESILPSTSINTTELSETVLYQT